MIWKNIRKYFVLSILTVSLIIGFSPNLSAQIPFFTSVNSTVENGFPVTPSWDLNKAYPCSKYWCSKVFLVGNNEFLEEELVIALPRDNKKLADEISLDIEQRARFVQNIYKEIINNISQSNSLNFSTESHPLNFWLINHKKPIHPSTPLVEIGTENEQTVIYIPAKLELGLTQQAIVTVTSIDAKANVTTIQELAEKWRVEVRKSLSDAIWGIEMNRKYPLIRIHFSGVITISVIAIILLIKFLKKIIKKWSNKSIDELKNIKEILIVNPEAKTKENTEVKKENNYNLSFEEFQNKSPEKSPQLTNETNKYLENLDWIGSIINRIFNRGLRDSQQVIAEGLAISSRILPQTFQQKQNILKQEINLAQLIIRILFLSQITITLLGIGIIVASYRESRFLFNLFFSQALLIPIIWILMILADKFVDFWIDYSLNQWAEEIQARFPDSNRPTLRVNTYSPAFQGATTILFGAIGLFLTFTVIGINPSIIAGAGALAVVFAFISRNLLEDMLNGILILATDRYAVGDVVIINGLDGCVEEMNIYSTSLRNLDGQLIVIPNGQISTVINMTKNWSQVNFTIRVSWNADLRKTMKILQTLSEQMYQEAEWQERILKPAEILGIEEVSHEGILIRLLIKTKPAQHWNVGREFRLRVKQALDKEGVILGIPQREVWHHNLNNQNENNHELSSKYKTFIK